MELRKGTRFHSDLALMEELDLLSDRAVILADNVLKPGAPLYIWHLAKGSCRAESLARGSGENCHREREREEFESIWFEPS